MFINKIASCIFILTIIVFPRLYAAQDAPQTFTFDGRAFADNAATRPMLDTITTKVQILNAAQDPTTSADLWFPP